MAITPKPNFHAGRILFYVSKPDNKHIGEIGTTGLQRDLKMVFSRLPRLTCVSSTKP